MIEHENYLVKYRPIIFNTEMVRAILDGRKTQTRRPIKSTDKLTEKHNLFIVLPPLKGYRETTKVEFFRGEYPYKFECVDIKSPFGNIGDKLWVRETFCKLIYYTKPEYEYDEFIYKSHMDHFDCKWSPPIHMPRSASRITLEITDIRVERLQDISEEDVRAEGFDNEDDVTNLFHFNSSWSAIYGDGNFKSNPWVWVIEFRRVEQ